MGTRSETAIFDGMEEICRIYRQHDGYPDGHGLELAKLCNVQVVNGYGGDMKAGTHANGMGCLAAQIIKGLKDGIGGIYMTDPRDEYSDGVDYIYVVRGHEGETPTIQVIQNIKDGKTSDPMPADKFAAWVNNGAFDEGEFIEQS